MPAGSTPLPPFCVKVFESLDLARHFLFVSEDVKAPAEGAGAAAFFSYIQYRESEVINRQMYVSDIR